VSLGHSSSGTKEPELGVALEPTEGDQDTAVVEPLAALGQEAVPLRERHPDDFEKEREQRIKALVGKRRQRIPRPGRRARMLAAGGVAIGVVLLVAVLSTGDRHPTPKRVATPEAEPQAVAASVADRSDGRRQHLVRPHPRRRAAIQAKRKVTRRHAQRERAHRRTANVEEAPSQSEAPVTESSAPASAPPPVTATTESAPPPASSPPPSASTDPAGEEFGFER
jgi:hypothetical protein